MTTRDLTVLEQLAAIREGRSAKPVTARDASVVPVVARYARISDDQEDEDTGEEPGIGSRGGGVRRQLRTVDSLIEARDWKASETDYTDNDLSAFKAHVRRPGFEQMLADLAAGVIDGIVCYDLDRFVRQPRDLERAIEIYDKAKKAGRPLLFASAQGDINLSSEDGIAFARVLVVFANKASRDTARRVALKHAENRDNLKLVGGRRPFGWEWIWDEIVDANGVVTRQRSGHELREDEAELIRTTAQRIIDERGANWARIALTWQASGVQPVGGKAWTQQTVRKTMTSPRLAGWMVHKEKIAIHSETGLPLRGTFPAILDDETYEEMLALAGPGPSGRRMGGTHDSVRKYLLSGLVRCGECGATMDANARKDRSSTVRHYYRCRETGRTTPGGEMACGSNTVSGVKLDALISELVLPRLIEASRTSRSVDLPHRAALADLSDERAGLARELAEGEVGSDVLLPRIRVIEAESARLRAEQEMWLAEQGVRRLAVGLSEKRWGGMSVSERRELIASQLQNVVVAKPTRPTGSGFDHERVQPVWRQPAA